jgi:hypothetical protein
LVVAGLCGRKKKTQRNTEKWRLMERVKWLYDLLQLLRSSPPPPQMTMEEGPAPTTTARRLQMKYHAESQFLQIRGKSVHAMANEDEQIPYFLYGDGDRAQLCSEFFIWGRGIVHSFVPKLKQGGFLVSEATNKLI